MLVTGAAGERDCGDESADGAVTMLFGAVGVDSLLAIFCFLLGIFAFCFFLSYCQPLPW